MGLQIGGQGYGFEVTDFFGTRGCYAYSSGYYSGTIYYGMGGTTQQMQGSLRSPKYRPPGYDCSIPGHYILIISHYILRVRFNFYSPVRVILTEYFHIF